MTSRLRSASSTVRAIRDDFGLVARVRDGEFRVNYVGGSEASAYYTNDRADAYGTAADLAFRAAAPLAPSDETDDVRPFIAAAFADLGGGELRYDADRETYLFRCARTGETFFAPVGSDDDALTFRGATDPDGSVITVDFDLCPDCGANLYGEACGCEIDEDDDANPYASDIDAGARCYVCAAELGGDNPSTSDDTGFRCAGTCSGPLRGWTVAEA
jgi:hypothetical protein